MICLVDTSVWIRHFSGRDPFDLRDVAAPDERVLCLPVYQELLQGIRDETIYRDIKEILDAGQFVDDPLSRDVIVMAAELYRFARRKGHTVRASADCLIAASAIRHDLTVLHSDRDFPQIAEVSALKELRV